MIVSFLSVCHYWLLRDLLGHLKGIKFKNKELEEVNCRLQRQVEEVESEFGISMTTSLNMDTINQQILRSDDHVQDLEGCDIEQHLAKEIVYCQTLLSEKIMTEAELAISKEHIASLTGKLTQLNNGLMEKKMIVFRLKSIITQHKELCAKLIVSQDEVIVNKNTAAEVTNLIRQYENEVDTIINNTNESVEASRAFLSSDDVVCQFNEQCNRTLEDSLNEEYVGHIKVELARGCINPWNCNMANGDAFLDHLWMDVEESVSSSCNMLKEQMSMLSSLRMIMIQYKDNLEKTGLIIKSPQHFVDEITMIYISRLNNSMGLLAASLKKALQCQNQFNETFEFLWKQISTLKNEKETLNLKNKQLQFQVENSPSNITVDVAEKICFLEEELRKERLLGFNNRNKIHDLEKKTLEYGRELKWKICDRCSIKLSMSSEVNRSRLASEALNLERTAIRHNQRSARKRSSNAERDSMNTKINSWLQSKKIIFGNSTTSIDELHLPCSQGRNGKQKRNEDTSADDQPATPRYKLSMAQQTNIDINDIIENSWLETNSMLEERRASVFAQTSEIPTVVDTVDINIPSLHQPQSEIEKSCDKTTRRIGRTSSSCSSSNDTSDTASIDVSYERLKLAQELESRILRLQSRSPIPSLSGYVNESVTPTMNEDDSAKANCSTDGDGTTRDIIPSSSTTEESSLTDSVYMDQSSFSRRSSITRQSVIFNPCPTPAIISPNPRHSLPTISVVEVLGNEPLKSCPFEPSQASEPTQYSFHTIDDVQDDNILQTSQNRSRFSSRASSVADGDYQVLRRSKPDNRRNRRPYTVAGIGVSNTKVVQDDTITNSTTQPAHNSNDDLQRSLDFVQEMRQLLSNIRPEDLESKFNEICFICSTDRISLVDRAQDANRRCHQAFVNVDQEFNIIRHLIKSIAQLVNRSSEFLPRIRTSVNVLEKCVDCLSARYEQLGAVKQEIKMASVFDVMNEYFKMIVKQRSDLLQELQEIKLWRESVNDMMTSGTCDLSKLRRNITTGRDMKTRFQLLAQSAAIKSSIVRQLTSNSSASSSPFGPVADPNESSELPYGDMKGPLRRGVINNEGEEFSVNENAKVRKFATSKFFPEGYSVPENGDNLFQKGLQQGVRISYDKALTELKTQQSQFSLKLDSIDDLLKESDQSQASYLWYFSDNLCTRWIARTKNLFRININPEKIIKESVLIVMGLLIVVAFIVPWLLTPSVKETAVISHRSSRRDLQLVAISQDQPLSSSSSSSDLSSPLSDSLFPQDNLSNRRSL